MGNRNIFSLVLMFLISIIIFIENDVYAGRRNKEREECEFTILARKCLSCFMRKQTFNDEDEEFLLEGKSVSFVPDVITERTLENLPIEMFWKICYKLPPLDIIRLCFTSKKLKVKIDEDFWESYLKVHGQERWDQLTPAVKVAYAFSFFEKGRIAEAAKLGLPKAVEIIWKSETETEVKKWESSPSLDRKRYQNFPYKYGGSFLDKKLLCRS